MLRMGGLPELHELLSLRQCDVKIYNIGSDIPTKPLSYGQPGSGPDMGMLLRFGPDENRKFVQFYCVQSSEPLECVVASMADLFVYESTVFTDMGKVFSRLCYPLPLLSCPLFIPLLSSLYPYFVLLSFAYPLLSK